MLSEVMASINNYFAEDTFGNFLFPPEQGKFKIENQILTGVENKPVAGSYFAVTGSRLNNGVYLAIDEQITLEGALNEEFQGVIYRLAVPKEFVSLVGRIKEFRESDEGKAGNITSAAFGIQRIGFAKDSSGVRAGWQKVFSKELAQYRRMFRDITI